jgi:TonB-dependent SusC/RagA subfamily outer membrane receptor
MNRRITIVSDAPTRIRLPMTAIPNVLSGVVTTATGTQRKLEVGNDITTLNVDSIQQIAPIASVTDLLESRVPGLTVLRSSGAPGDPARLRLRGPKSITGSNDPIVVVDGIRMYAAQSDQRTANLARATQTTNGSLIIGNRVPPYAAPSPLDQIDPNSIETIEVLKGPSASSLYGSDAANGVIVVTTKRGRAGPTRWQATIGQGVSYLPGEYPVQTIRWAHQALGDRLGSHPCDISILACNVFDSVTHIQVL